MFVQGFAPSNRTQLSTVHVPPINGKNKLSAGQNSSSSSLFLISFLLSLEMSSYVFEQIDYRNLANALMYENQVNCWRDKQRESSYLVRLFFTNIPKTNSFISI